MPSAHPENFSNARLPPAFQPWHRALSTHRFFLRPCSRPCTRPCGLQRDNHSSHMLYEDQAAGFDQRAGLDPQTGDAIARAPAELAVPEPQDAWLEIGAGTGLLSIPMLHLGIRYIGFDQSPAMLER